jgi:sugar lactone lactonase YvrE
MRRSEVANPVLDFEIDRNAVQYVGRDLQRPECILAEPDGTLWVADARGGVVRILDGEQQIVAPRRSDHFGRAGSEASRYLEGTLPNGLAFAGNGDILISNFGTDCLEVMTRDGESRLLADSIDGEPIGKVNFVLRDSRDRIWITVSTRIKNWMHALRTDLPDGYIARYDSGTFRIVADGFRFTNEIRFDAREEYLYVVETTGGCISRLRVDEREPARPGGVRTGVAREGCLAGRNSVRQLRQPVGHARVFRQAVRADA